MTTHTHSQYVEIIAPGGSMEVEVAISYTFRPYQRETGPTYACGGTPAEPASVEDIQFEAYAVDYSESGRGRQPWKRGEKLEIPGWLEAFIEGAIDESELIENACEYEAEEV